MIDFLLNNLGSQQFYYYLDVPSVGSLYNLNKSIQELIKNELDNDSRILCNCCMCNICDGVFIDSVIEMYAFYDGNNIILTCPWYYEILHSKLK